MWWNSGTVKVQQCCRTVLVEQWDSESGTVWWNSGTVLVEQCWWNSGIVMVEERGDRVEQ